MANFEVVANAIEKNHIINLLDSDRRLDGRSKLDMREIKIETNIVGTAHGSAIVHLGKTKVICGVKAVLSAPWSEYPNKGSMFVGFEASPLSSPSYRAGPPQDHAIELARMTDRAIRESECIDLEDLCIIEGEKVYTINIDLYSLDDYGNLYDACVLAAVAALATAHIPKVENIDGKVNFIDETRPLKMNAYPVSVTSYKVGDHIITDAEFKEERIADARISFGTTQHYIVSGQKGGLGAFKSQEIMDTLTHSIQKASKIREFLAEEIGIKLN